MRMHRMISRIAGVAREAGWYARRRLTGMSYADYYAMRMNSIVRRNPEWGLNNDRDFQLKFLIEHGLQPSSRLLDYGCGALAAGILFVDYLQPNRYVGVDIADGVVAEGHKRLRSLGLGEKQAELFVVQGTSLKALAGRRFEFIWAQSVLTHMPPDDVRSLLREVRPLLAPGGTFYASFARSTRVRQRRFKDWYYTLEFMRSAAAQADYTIDFPSDWRHPHDPEGRVDTMMKLVPAKTSATPD